MGKDKSDRKESSVELERLRVMHQETTDPMASRLLGDILSEMEGAFPSTKGDTDEPAA